MCGSDAQQVLASSNLKREVRSLQRQKGMLATGDLPACS